MRDAPPLPPTVDSRPDPRSRGLRGEETRDRLLRAASQLFARTGYDGTAITDVAREAGIGVGTVYHHFSDKRALLLDLLRRHESAVALAAGAGGLSGPLAAAWAWDDTLAGITDVIRRVAAMRPHPGIFAIALEVARRDDAVAACCARLHAVYRRMLQADIALGQERGRVRPELDAEIAAVLLYDALDTGIRRLDESRTGDEREDQIAALAEMIHRYLVAR